MLKKYTEAELRAEIQKEIARLLEEREAIHPAWLTHAICKRHRNGLAVDADNGADIEEPEDVAFWRFGGYYTTRKLATSCINDLEPGMEDTADDAQPFLPGYQYLRPQYVTKRDGVDVMVPIEQMTPGELEAKANQYERNSVTLAEHARELRRYAIFRREAAI
jgi:hypothetical protein